MKKAWDSDDSNMFMYNRFSILGLTKYWQSIDSGVEFNLNFKESRQSFNKQQNHTMNNYQQKADNDRFHWNV